MKHTPTALLIAAALACAPAYAAAKKPAKKPGVPKALAPLMAEKNVRFIESFKSVSGITGYAFQVGVEARTFYVLPDGKTVLNGDIVLEDGTEVTQADERKYAAKLDFGVFWNDAPAFPDDMQPIALRALAAANVASLGTAQPRVFMLFDGYCGYCRMSWLKLKPLGDLPFGVIPVARMNQRSLNLAAALLEASDKRFTMDMIETDEAREVLLQRYAQVAPESLTHVSANNALMDQLGIGGTPTWLWVGEDGKVRQFSGVIPERAMISVPGSVMTPAAAVAKADAAAPKTGSVSLSDIGAGGGAITPPATAVASGAASAAAAMAAATGLKPVEEDAIVEVIGEPVLESGSIVVEAEAGAEKK